MLGPVLFGITYTDPVVFIVLRNICDLDMERLASIPHIPRVNRETGFDIFSTIYQNLKRGMDCIEVCHLRTINDFCVYHYPMVEHRILAFRPTHERTEDPRVFYKFMNKRPVPLEEFLSTF